MSRRPMVPPAPAGLSRRRMMQALGAAVVAAVLPSPACAPPAAPEAPPRQPWTGRDRRPRWIGHC